MRRACAHLFKAALLLGALTLAVLVVPAGGDEAPASSSEQAPEKAKIEQFLKKIVESQGGGRIVIDQWKPSPIPGLWELHYFMDALGQRKPGMVYISGDKLILGQIIDTSTEKNLTAGVVGKPTKTIYRLEDFDLEGRIPRGEPSAPLTLIEFSDFQCPFCKQLHETLTALMAKYPSKVRLYYKHFPLTNLHPLAYSMALAAECARDQKAGAFWALHDDFFAHQETGGDSGALATRLKAWAAQNGLNGNQLVDCVQERKPDKRIAADMRDAHMLGITSTPVVIANGEFIGGAQPLETFERFLNPAASPPAVAPPAPPASSPPALPAR
jgi:protein-disulfide isomerase